MHKAEHKKGVATTQQVGEEQEEQKKVVAAAAEEEEDVMDIAQGTNGTDDQSLY